MSAHSAQAAAPKVTARSFQALKDAGTKIVVITAYDFHSARLVDGAGVDAILVGDSMGMTVLGHDSTLPVTVDDIVSATRAVSRATTHAMVIADMPFMSYHVSIEDGMRNAGRMVAQGGAHAVKLEGAAPTTLELIGRLVAAGVPVMGHLGLTPQSVNCLGGYCAQAKDVAGAAQLMADAVALQQAGAFSLVLECVPGELAAHVSRLVDIPTIGIGAGAGCDGEVQVFHDLLGIGEFLPRHARRYADLGSIISGAVGAYAEDVRAGAFPTSSNTTSMDADTLVAAENLYAAAADPQDER